MPERLRRGVGLLLVLIWLAWGMAGCTWPWAARMFAGWQAAVPSPGATALLPRQDATVSPQPTPTNPPDCRNMAAPGAPMDITFPDGAVLFPGEPFTKVWRVLNAGTCTWTPDYRLVWFAGPHLGAPTSVPLGVTVPPGQTVELAVDMVAPLTAGTYQSYWKLSDGQGHVFGIGEGEGMPFWVRIVVPRSERATPTLTPTITPPPTATATMTPSPTPTPPVLASRQATLALGDGVEVDGSKTSATDALYLLIGQVHILRPQDAARWGIFGPTRPTLEACRTSKRSAADIPVDSLPAGTYLCYRSSDGHWGYARLEGVQEGGQWIVLSFVTWALP